MIKKIETLKDLRDYLNQIKDSDLEKLGIGENFESDGEVTVVAYCNEDEENYMEVFERNDTKLLSRWIENIKYCHERYNDQEVDEAVFEEGFITSDKLDAIKERYSE